MDRIEMEHVIGFTGCHRSTLYYHPSLENVVVFGMGCNVVVQNVSDPHKQDFLSGHTEEVSALCISEKGILVASGQVGSRVSAEQESDVLVFDLSRKVEIYRLTGVTRGVSALGFSPDEMFLAAAGEDGSLFVWDISNGETLALRKENQVITTITWDKLQNPASQRPEYVFYATVGPQVTAFRLKYSVASMQYVMSLERFQMPTSLIRTYLGSAISPCGGSLLLCTSIGDVNVYDLQNQVYRSCVPMCSGGAQSLCVSKADKCVYVGGGDGTVKRLRGNGSSWNLDAEISLHGSIKSLSMVRDGSKLVAGTSTGKIYEISSREGELQVIRVVQNETSELVGVSFKDTSSIQFATLSRQGHMRVWDLSDYSIIAEADETKLAPGIRTHRGNEAHGLCLHFDGVEDHVLTGWSTGELKAFNAKPGTGNKVWEIAIAHRDGVNCISATPMYYATGGVGGGVRLWSRKSRAQLFEFPDHMMKPVTGLLPDWKIPHLLHSCGMDCSIYTYDLKKERRIMHHQLSRAGAFSSMTQRHDSENELITAGLDGRLLTWDYDVAEPVSEICDNRTRSVPFTCVQISPKTGRFIAAASANALIQIWNVETGDRIVSVQGHSGSVTALAWSPDEKQLVSVSKDKCICIWNFYDDSVPSNNKAYEHKA